MSIAPAVLAERTMHIVLPHAQGRSVHASGYRLCPERRGVRTLAREEGMPRVLLAACVSIGLALGNCWPAAAESKWVWVVPRWDEQGIASLPKYVEALTRVDAMQLPKNEQAKAVESSASTSGLSPRAIQLFRAVADDQYAEVKANKPGAWWMTIIDGFIEADAQPTEWRQFGTFESISACEQARMRAWHIVVNRLRQTEEDLDTELATQPLDRWATIGERAHLIARDTAVRQSSCVPEILLR